MLSHLPASLRRIVIATCISIFLSALIPVPIAMGQTTGTLIGQVFNEQGQAVSGAKITILNEDSGNEYATVTDGSGSYRRPLLPPGNYRITASSANYSPGSVNVRVPLNATTEIKPPAITLRSLGPVQPVTPTNPTPGQPTQPTAPTTVPPTGQVTQESGVGSLINKTDAARGGNFTERELESLPLGGGATMRSFDELALLVPGVLPPPYTPGVRGPGVGFGIGTAGQFSVNGLRARSNNFTIDGSDNNDPDVGVRRQGFVALVPQSIESVQEFQISTLLWDAELGRNFGSQVNAVSKGGPAAIHGQVYGFFTHNSLNARNAFDFLGGASDGEDPFTRLQAGAVIGGPIGKMKKTQWFASYEYLNINSTVEQHFAVPPAAKRRFLNSSGLDIATLDQDFNFLVVRAFSGASPVGENVFSIYPLPNNPGGPFGESTYTANLPADGDGSIASFRLTHQLTQNNTFNGRYNFTDDNRTLPNVNRAIRSSIIADSRTQNLSLILDSALNLNLFNQARFSYGRTRLDFPAYLGNRFRPCSASSNPISNSLPDNPLVFCSDDFASRAIIDNLMDDPFEINVITDTGPLGQLTIEPFDPVGVDVSTFPTRRSNNTFQFADTLSWNYRTHSFKFGADVRRYQLNSLQDRNYRPSLVFTNGVFVDLFFSDEGNIFINDTLFVDEQGGTSLAALGLPSSLFQTITPGPANSAIGLRFTEYNLFFNDNVRLTPKLTLDYGLRYEYNSVPHEVNNRIEDALALKNLPPSTTPDPSFQGFVDVFDASVAAYKQVLDGRTGIYDPDRNNFGPHIGFAWAPDLRTSIRAGYGIYYDAILGAVVSQSRNVFPNEIPVAIDPSFLPSSFFLNNAAFLFFGSDFSSFDNKIIRQGTLNEFGLRPDLLAAGIGALFALGQNGAGGLSFTLPEKDLRTPYAQHWHLTLEREVLPDYLVSFAYVGTKGTKLTRLTTPNLGPNRIPTAALFGAFSNRPLFLDPFAAEFGLGIKSSGIPINRPNPNLGAYRIFENSANSNYHALQLEARKRYNHGYTFTAAYTWSHAIDEVSDVFPIAGAPILPQDSNNLRAERASANYDIRHRFVASVVWDLPFYRGAIGRAADILGGWQITSIFQAHTGQPFTLNLPFDANLDGNLTDRPSTTDGLIFFDGHGSRRVALPPGGSFIDFLNTSGGINFNGETGLVEPFLIPGTGFIGRNTLRGDGFINLDMALAKNFRFNESQALEFRTEVFNVLNRTNYGLPIRTIGAPGFGSSIDTVNPARIIQFALKYSF